MRKDVRIGLSIGGVLLAVLIVYLLVPKDNTSTNRNKGNQVAHSGANGQGSGAGELSGGTSGGNTQGGLAATDSGQTPTPGGSGSGADANSGQRPIDVSGAQPIPSTIPTETGNAQTGQAEANNGGADWASILDHGVLPPSLIATKDPFADDTKRNGNAAGAGTGAARDNAARNTPGPSIDWNGSGTATPAPPASGSTGASAGATPNTLRNSGGASALAPGRMSEHVVQPHETFSTIALAVYGEARYFKALLKANPNIDERHLRPGMVIKVPDPSTVKAAATPVAGAGAGAGQTAPGASSAARTEPPIDPSTQYRVQPGDNLHKIALKLYGKATKSDAIYEANKEKIGPDEHKIKVGMVLKLPEKPTLSPTATR